MRLGCEGFALDLHAPGLDCFLSNNVLVAIDGHGGGDIQADAARVALGISHGETALTFAGGNEGFENGFGDVLDLGGWVEGDDVVIAHDGEW